MSGIYRCICFIILLFFEHSFASIILSTPRCTDPTEEVQFKRISKDGEPSDCCDSYKLIGLTSGCHFHFFNKKDISECMQDQHLIMIGGSITSSIGKQMLQLLDVSDYPVNIDDHYNCTDCNIRTSNPGSIGAIDIVLDRQGNVLSKVAQSERYSLESRTGGRHEQNSETFVDGKMKHTKIPPGGFRFTFLRMRYLDAIVPVVSYIQDKLESTNGLTLFLGARNWWYEFCWEPAKAYCPRDDFKNWKKEQVVEKIVTDATALTKQLSNNFPSLQRVIFTGDRANKNYEDIIVNAVQKTNDPRIVVWEDRYYFKGLGEYDIDYANHPSNKKVQMILSRLFNILCDSAGYYGDAALDESISFTSKGCTAELIDGKPFDNWAKHSYQPCTWESKVHLPDDFQPITDAPTNSPTLNCLPDGELCDSDSDCCSELCGPEFQGGNDTCIALVTDTPTFYPTDTRRPTTQPTEMDAIDDGLLPLQSWDVETTVVSWLLEPDLLNVPENNKGIVRSDGMDDSAFRYMLASISFFIVLFYLVAMLRKKKSKEDQQSICTTIYEYVDYYLDECMESFGLKQPEETNDAPSRDHNPNSIVYSANKQGDVVVKRTKDYNNSMRRQGTNATNVARLSTRNLDALESGRNSKRKSFRKPNIPPVEEEEVVQEQPKKHKKPSNRLNAFGTMRFVASVHIVAGHLVRLPNNVISPWHTHNFGYTWVPWFMMLSGFILSYARLSSSNPDELDPWYIFTGKRIKSIYPLYLTSLFCAAAIDAYQKQVSLTLGTPLQGFTSFFLLQAWIPSVAEHVFQQHCWFLSCIIPYWMLHNASYRIVKSLSTKAIQIVCVVLCVLPWLFIVLIPLGMGDLTWYNKHQYGEYGEAVDTWVIMLKHHPLFYWHTYLFGILLAVLNHRYRWDPPFLFRWGTVIGYVGLFAIFAAAPFSSFPPAAQLSCRLGILFPFQGLLLLGAAVQVDPVASFFAWKIFKPLGDLSYPQYLFQFIVLRLWGITSPTNAGYWFVLLALSVIGFAGIQKPIRPWKLKRNNTYFIVLFAMILMPCFLVALFAIRIGVPETDPFQIPEFVRFSQTAVDSRLNIAEFEQAYNVRLPTLASTIESKEVYYTNPSILWSDELNSFIFALRRHHLLYSIEKGFFIFENDTVALNKESMQWFSDIVVGTFDWDVDPLSDGASYPEITYLQVIELEGEWDTCNETQSYLETNQTLSLLSRVGAEDPRLVRLNDGTISVTYNRVPPGATCEEESRMYTSSLFDEVELKNSRDAFQERSIATQQVLDKVSYPTQKLVYDYAETTVKEKNWISIVHPKSGEFFIRNLNPFQLIRFNEEFGTYEEIFSRKLDSFEAANKIVHGGANAVRIGILPGRLSEYYLATFHTIDETTGEYINYFVELNGDPPFQVLRISRAIPLLQGLPKDRSIDRPISFSSGLSAIQDPASGLYSYYLSYGSSNVDARVLSFSAYEMEELFSIKSYETNSPTESPTPEPTTSPTTPFPTASPTVQQAELDDPCRLPWQLDNPNLLCAPEYTCVQVPEVSKCVLCRNPDFQYDCKYWSLSNFISAAERICGIECKNRT